MWKKHWKTPWHLEAAAAMALGTRSIGHTAPELEPWVLQKHYRRKHDPSGLLQLVA